MYIYSMRVEMAPYCFLAGFLFIYLVLYEYEDAPYLLVLYLPI